MPEANDRQRADQAEGSRHVVANHVIAMAISMDRSTSVAVNDGATSA